MKGLSQDRIKKRFNEEKLVGDNFKMRPLLDHFEKTRFIKDDDVRKALAEAGFLELDTLDVFYTYADKTIKIREFASTFGPNGEFLEQAFTEVDKAFKGVRNSDSHLAYKNAMKDTVNAFFGKYGDAWHGTHPVASVTIKSLVGLANMMYLTRVGVTSLADFISPWKTSTFAAATKGVTGRFQPGGALHKRAGLQYDNSFELELSALLVHSVDPLQSVTQKLNNMQRGFFRITGLKTVTEAAGKYAFDVGAYRAFEISEQLIKNPKISKALGRELKELGLQEDDLSNLARFKSAEEAFGDDTGREILTRAGQKAMDRDRLVPKVGNRLLFTQHRDPFIRSFGQFMSWTQAKTAQTNALVKRIEDGDAKLAARMLGATVIGTGAVQFLRDTIKPSYDPDRDLPTSDLENFTKKTFELSGELLPWWATKAGSAWKYNFKKGEGITEAASPALSYANDVLKGFGHSIENIAGGDVEGFAQDIVSVTPIAHEINKYLRRWDLPRLEDKSNGSSKSGRSRGDVFRFDPLATGGEVDIPNAVERPENRRNPYTGERFVDGAGGAFRADDDPLRRLGVVGGGSVDPLVRLGFSGGGQRRGLGAGSLISRFITRGVGRKTSDLNPYSTAARTQIPAKKTPAPGGRIQFNEGGATYNIQRGDTLSRLADRFNTTVERLAAMNKIKDINKISAGQDLKIPEQRVVQRVPPKRTNILSALGRLLVPEARASAKPKPKSYTVQAGDTLSEIAGKSGISSKDLIRINKIKDPNRIAVGQTLRLPVTEAPPEQKEGIFGRVLGALRKMSPITEAEALQAKAPPEQADGVVDEIKNLFGGLKETMTLPENLVAYGKWVVGNKIANITGKNIEGSDINVGDFDESVQDVYRAAVENARKDDRTSIRYTDYPLMENGMRPWDFYRGEFSPEDKRREKQSKFDLVTQSFRDPVFEAFTTTGVFNFKNNPDGGFDIVGDPYGFDPKKSPTRSPYLDEYDAYSEAVHGAHDIEAAGAPFSFNVVGTVQPRT